MQSVTPLSPPRPRTRPRLVVRPGRLREHWPALVAAAVTVALGLPMLNWPYGPDQALFAYFGEKLAHGAGLYVDVWDVKPPGIFWIYTFVSVLPGPEFKVLRAFDLAYTALTVVALYALGRAYWGRLAGAIGGALYGMVYVTATGYWNSAQPDSFMVLPLAGALLAAEEARRRDSGRLTLLSGALFGLCVQLRPVALLVPAALILVHLADERGRRWSLADPWHTSAFRRALLLVAGVVAIELVTLLWLALYGAVGEYLYAQLSFAGQYGRQGGPYSPDGLTLTNYLSGLRTGTMFIIFARTLLAAPALAAVVVGLLLRRQRHIGEVALYALAAYAGVVVQGKYFLYHWHTVLMFLALLAGWLGAFTWRQIRAAGRSPAAAGVTLGLIGGLLLLLTPNVTDKGISEWSAAVRYYTDPASRPEYNNRFGLYGRGSFSFRASDEAARYVQERTAPGDTIFVWGYDPLLYVLSGRDSPSRFISFLPLMSTWTPQRWVDEWLDDLERERPAYIITQRGENARWITGHSIDAVDYIKLLPRFQALLENEYVFERGIEDYGLYRRR